MLTIIIGSAQAYPSIELFEMQGRVFKHTIKWEFASNEQLRVGVDGQVKVYCWVTEWETPNDPLPHISITGYNATGAQITELITPSKNDEYVSTKEYTTFDQVVIKGGFHVVFRQEPPRSSAGEAHEKSKAPRGLRADVLMFIGGMFTGGIVVTGFIIYREKGKRLFK